MFNSPPSTLLLIKFNYNQTLKEDLVETLFPPGHDKRERQRLQKKAKIHLNRHIILSGGRWAPLVQKWLLARGF